jgi:parvulin-like peptidyl-prolyl isomerase
MDLSLDFGDSSISADRAIEQLNRFGLYPQLLQEIAIDDLVEQTAMALSIDLEVSEAEFDLKYSEMAQLPLCQGMSQTQLEAICDRSLRLQKFKVAKWGEQVQPYFQAYGTGLDRVLISILQVKEAELAQELFYRVQSGEKSFAEIAIDYSVGIHAQNGGVMGPVLLSDLVPEIREILEELAPGELSSLFKIDQYHTFIRLDKREIATLDETRYQFLLDRLCSDWLKTQL